MVADAVNSGERPSLPDSLSGWLALLEARHGQRILCLVKINDLPIHMGLKRCECCEKINGFKYAGLALRVFTHKQNHPA